MTAEGSALAACFVCPVILIYLFTHTTSNDHDTEVFICINHGCFVCCRLIMAGGLETTSKVVLWARLEMFYHIRQLVSHKKNAVLVLGDSIMHITLRYRWEITERRLLNISRGIEGKWRLLNGSCCCTCLIRPPACIPICIRDLSAQLLIGSWLGSIYQCKAIYW